MKHIFRRLVVAMFACALQAHTSFIMAETIYDDGATATGYDNSGGSFDGIGAFGGDVQTADKVTVIGNKCNPYAKCYSVWTWNTYAPGYLLSGGAGGGSGDAAPPTPPASSPDQQQKDKETCTKNCDIAQTMANDICDYTYSNMANSSQGVGAVTGVAFLVYGITKFGGVGGLATGMAAYEGAQSYGERAATMYLRGCKGQASLAHYNCYKDKCHA